jgi:hypothetical protein
MALTNLNISWYGQPSGLAAGQIYGNNSCGPQNRVLTGIATITLDGAATTGVINFIDGVNSPYQIKQVVGVSSVAAPATIGGVANQAVYTGVGAYGQLRVGQSITFAGFTNAGNNGTFTINALTTSTIQVTNASSVAESNPQASLSFTFGALVAGVQANRGLASTLGVADTAANTITATPSLFTQTGFTITLSAAGSNGQTLSVLVQLFPSN